VARGGPANGEPKPSNAEEGLTLQHTEEGKLEPGSPGEVAVPFLRGPTQFLGLLPHLIFIAV
jgi:hypothetical protein